METQTPQTETLEETSSLAKTVVVTATTTAALIGGIVAMEFVRNKLEDRKVRKNQTSE